MNKYYKNYNVEKFNILKYKYLSKISIKERVTNIRVYYER